ncbi:MAG: hypothetical protein KAJ86_05360 [Alphaproteobacteria bacterium]|nr:hypothetical protein [Alphaproteobacteria bacterium]
MALLTCFFAECESAFRFLELNHGYSHISGIVNYKQGRQIIIPYKGQSIDGCFLVVTRYEKNNHAIEIIYGGAEFMIEVYSFFDQIHRLSFSDILRATKKKNIILNNNQWLMRESQIKYTICLMADVIEKNKTAFITPSKNFIDRALTMREKRMENLIRAQYNRDKAYVCILAAKAFLNKDYRRVIELFRPFERDLSIADKKKLRLAHQYLLEQD